MPIDNLNKENFWNELHKKYPTAVNHFCKWIDEYKKENNWEQLFNCGSPHYAKMGWHSPKFHDLPFDMQNGILARFELELHNNADGKGKEVAEKIQNNYKEVLENLFKDLQGNMDKCGEKLN